MNLAELEFVDPVACKGWDEIVLSMSHYTFFHTSHWAKTLHHAYHYTPHYLIGRENGEVSFVIPLMLVSSRLTGRRMVSLPFTDFCPPLGNLSVNDIDRVLARIDGFRVKSVEWRGGQEYFGDHPFSIRYLQHLLPLTPDTDSLYNFFRSNTKRNIKKALSQNLEIVFDNSDKALSDFYSLNCLTRRKHGLPPQPLYFFEAIHHFILAKDLGSIVAARHDNITVASAIYFHFGNRAIYKYGASDMSYQHLRANNLVMWEAIKHYAKEGYALFDFGKTEVLNEGLRDFKLGWGTEEKEIYYYKYDFRLKKFVTEENKEQGWYNVLFRNLPMPVLKLSGKFLYPHVA
jgi:lipid II:glycine glycyltransferase (peptidoglycan interpeptide bridge formation enzyme)